MSETLRAGVAILLVPAVLLVTLMLVALGTGVGGLGSLTQIVNGPALSTAPPQRTTTSAVTARSLPRIPAAAPAATTSPAGSAVVVPGSAPGVAHVTPGASRGVVPRQQPPLSAGAPAATAPSRTPTTSTTPSSSTGSNQPAGQTPADQLAGQLSKAVQPVGQTVAGAVSSLVNLVAPSK
jgi:hypothetical protein